MKIRTKLVLVAALLTFLGLGVGFGITHRLLVGLRLGDLDEDNALLARVVLEATLALPQYEVPAVVHAYLVRESGVSAAQVYRDGALLWVGGPYDATEPLDPHGLAMGGGARTVGNWRVSTLSQDDLVVQVGRPITALRAILRPFALIAASLTAVLALATAAAAWVAGGVALRPLETLTRAAGTFVEGGELPAIRGNDEAAALAASFAALLGRLRRERERELGFMAYAAHELRTPIAALRATLEDPRLRREPPGPEFLGHLRGEARRLEVLARNLLALTRAEAGEVRAGPIDLADLAAEAYDRFLPLALQSGKDLQLVAAPAPVQADPQLVEQALNNLLMNAIRHGARGQLTLASGVEGEGAFLEVRDEGPGLPRDLQEGLGLRVARAVARAHRGELVLASDGRTTARLRLAAGGRGWVPPRP